MQSTTLERITSWRHATEASIRQPEKESGAEAGPSKVSTASCRTKGVSRSPVRAQFQVLVQAIGLEPAGHIQRKLDQYFDERPRDDDSERSEVDWEDPYERENEIYILALSAALQRHHDRDPAYVEKILRHALRQSGFCVESCKAYFLPFAPSKSGLAT